MPGLTKQQRAVLFRRLGELYYILEKAINDENKELIKEISDKMKAINNRLQIDESRN